jgi:carbonic anhydrase/acetyltransferase-like protein (isoleucine patch superfamily)
VGLFLKKMRKIILQDQRYLSPFNERARDLRIQNKPLWLIQRDVLTPYTDQELEIPHGEEIPKFEEPCLVYRDNLYFDSEFIKAFLNEAKRINKPCRAAFTTSDAAFIEHALPLSNSYIRWDDLYLADLWYYPNGIETECEPLVIDLLAHEVGYYHVPPYIAFGQEDMVFQVPIRSMIAIDSWVHIFIADVVFGLFKRGLRYEEHLKRDPFYKLHILSKALYEGKQVLECSELVKVGRNCTIDPRAVIHGPTTIGDNVTINAGAVIENCIIGDNVNISQDCQLMLSVVGDGSFLPFRSSLFMTTLMDNSMVAQNTCLQMCVVGRNSFIGAGSTFTDFNLLPTPIHARDGDLGLQVANRPVLGGCVGHNCRLGSGMIVFPARTIESDVVLLASTERRVIEKDIHYEDSDHHNLSYSGLHARLYPRNGCEEISPWQFVPNQQTEYEKIKLNTQKDT